MSVNPLLWAQTPRFLSRRVWLVPLVVSVVLLVIFGVNHVVFHVLAELFTVFLAFTIFFLCWGTYRFGRGRYLMFVAAGYFWVGALDLFHTLYFPGMRIFDEHGGDGNHSIQAWLSARALEAGVLLLAPMMREVRISNLKLMMALASYAIGTLVLLFMDWFPDAFEIGKGLTPFKIFSEYGIIAMLLAAMIVTYRQRSRFRTTIWMWMLAAMATTAVSEVFFTLYMDAGDFPMFAGHAVKILSYWLLFLGVWQVAVELPYLRSQLLDAAVENSPSVVVITDKDANIEYVNDAFTRVTGYSRLEALGKHPRFLSAETMPDENFRNMWATLRAGKVWKGYFENRRKNGSEYSEHATISSITDEQGKISHFVATKEDVTEQQRAEAYLVDNESTLNKTLLGAIAAVSELLEMRDPYTAGHSKRVSELAVTIANQLQVPTARVEGLRLAALLHDIGKIRVPMEILNKPGRLSDEEMALVRQHSEVGYQAIKHIPFPMNVPEIVRAHHEKWDGSGYPLGLAGEHIPLEAQILAAADVIESVTSSRPYREALGIDAAIKIVQQGRGTHFNPRVVDAVLKMREEGLI